MVEVFPLLACTIMQAWHVIQDTIGYSPEANSRVSKAIAWALSIVALCYVTFGCLGSAPFALSKYVPVITVDGLLGSDPQWLLDVVLICILLLVCGFYQVSRLCNTGCIYVQAYVPSKRLM